MLSRCILYVCFGSRLSPSILRFMFMGSILVYSPFADRVGLPQHNILSLILPVMDIFSVDL